MRTKSLTAAILIFLTLILITGRNISAKDIEFPPIQTFAWFPYEDTLTLKKGENSLTVQLYWSNTYIKDLDHDLYGDLETLSSEFTYRRGLTDRLTLQLSVKASKNWGGVLDGFIEGFHSLFGLRQGGRKEVPRYEMDYRFGDKYSYTSSQSVIHPVILSLMYKLYEKDAVSVNFIASAGIPLMSKKGFVSSKPHLTLGPVFNYKKGNFHLSLSALTAFYKLPDYLKDEDISERIFFSELKLRWKVFLAGVIYKSSPWNYTNMDKNPLVIYVGAKIFKWLEFTLVEEATPPLVSTPDVTFNIKITHSW